MSEVLIFGLPYSVTVLDEVEYDDEQCFGRVVFVDEEIQIKRCSPERMAATLLHEALHALDFECPGRKMMTENDVRRISSLIYRFLRDNPDLAMCIARGRIHPFVNTEEEGT